MTERYRVLPAADRDLDDQAAYLAREASLDKALRFYDAASATFERIARMPGIGELRESANARLEGLRVSRIEGFEKHLIFYRVGDAGIDIVRVIHGARDIDRILGQITSPDEVSGEPGE
jgi:toxin ParE1/3/4